MATSNALRCFCRRQPQLAKYGVDDRGRTFVHVKIFKQSKVYGEVIHYDGEVKIRCRECFRWNIIIFRSAKDAVLQETQPPEELDTPDMVGTSASARQGSK